MMYHSVNLSYLNTSKRFGNNEIEIMKTLSLIKSDIDQNMRQSQNNNADYIDYEDNPRYAHKSFKHDAKSVVLRQFQDEGRGNYSKHDDSSLVRVSLMTVRYP